MESYRIDLFLVAFAAALAPFLAGLPVRARLPVVVVELLLGMLLGPHVLGLADADGLIGTLGELGLTFLLFMVGLETNIGEVRGRPLQLAAGGWLGSFALALLCTYLLHGSGFIQTPLLAAVALSTTALGVVAPVLRDRGLLDGDFGRLLLAAAAMGEIGPLLVISALIVPAHSPLLHTMLMVAFAGLLFAAAYFATHFRSTRVAALLAQTMQSSGQWPVRLCIALQALLVLLAGEFGFNVVIGAFAAGLVVGLVSHDDSGRVLRQKLDAIGYGFMAPFFFIAAGMRFDLAALWADPLVPVQIVVFLLLMLLVRGLPALCYGRLLTPLQRWPFALYSATGLPLIVIITEIGVSSGLMTADRAAVLVSTGMISVLLFPLLAESLQLALPDWRGLLGRETE